MNSPLEWWAQNIGPVAPVGHALTRYLPNYHIRFHSLPKSKRYADSKLEYSELLSRHDKVTNDLFVLGEQIFIYRTALLNEDAYLIKSEPDIAGIPLPVENRIFYGNPGKISIQDDDRYVGKAISINWKPEFFDLLVVRIADELDYGITFASPGSGNIYCPYDGGMDVFANPKTLAIIIRKFIAFLPDS